MLQKVTPQLASHTIAQKTCLKPVLPHKKPALQPALQIAASTVAAIILGCSPAGAAEKIAAFEASGFIFKDSVEVTAFDDPDVRGVTVFVSDFKRNLVDKLQKDFFTEPSQASLTCAITGPISVEDMKSIEGNTGKEVFSEKKSLNLFQDKTLRVRRVYDSKRKTLVYIAYSTRLSSAADDGGVTTGRYRTSLCAVSLASTAPPVSVTSVAEQAAMAAASNN